MSWLLSENCVSLIMRADRLPKGPPCLAQAPPTTPPGPLIASHSNRSQTLPRHYHHHHYSAQRRAPNPPRHTVNRSM